MPISNFLSIKVLYNFFILNLPNGQVCMSALPIAALAVFIKILLIELSLCVKLITIHAAHRIVIFKMFINLIVKRQDLIA